MPDTLPLFPLGSTVLFPGVLLPLHVFEERYRELVRTLVAREAAGAGEFGVVAIRQGWEVGADAVRALHGVGCAAAIRRVSPYPDGRLDVITVGARRFRLLEVDGGSRPYLVGQVEWLADDPADDVEAGLLAAGVGTLFETYAEAAAALHGTAVEPYELPADPSALSYLVASSALLTLDDRQALLEAATAAARLRAELRLLKRETTMVRRLHAVPTALADLQVGQSLN